MSVKKKGLYIGALAATFLWGSAFPCVKVGYNWLGIHGSDTGSQLLFAGIRFLLAGVSVLLAGSLKEKRNLLSRQSKISGKNLKILLLLALTQTFLQYFFYYIGLAHVTGTKGSIMNSLGTLFTVIFGMIYYKTRPEAGKIAGVFLGLSGVILACFSGTGMEFHFAGEGALFLSAIFIAIGNIVNKKACAGQNPFLVTGFHLGVGGFLLFLVGVFMGGSLQVNDVKTVLLICYMIFISAAGFGIWSFLLKSYPVEKVAVFMFLTPVFGTLLSGVILGEPLKLSMFIALFFVCIGIILVQREKA